MGIWDIVGLAAFALIVMAFTISIIIGGVNLLVWLIRLCGDAYDAWRWR